jgi:vacuolar-type H+-ATPase subunit I/STV1
MNPTRPDTPTSPQLDLPNRPSAQPGTPVKLWRVNLLRFGYVVVGVGLAVKKWPMLFSHEPWGLMEGTVQCMLVAMSLLALLGIRYPLRMLPILLFEVGWKLIWLGVVALPLWWNDQLSGATRVQVGWVLWVAIVIAVIPWRHVWVRYVSTPGEPWRTRK